MKADIGVLHVATTSAAIGFCFVAIDRRSMVKLNMGCIVHIATVLLIEAVPVAFATTIDGAIDSESAIGARGFAVINHHIGRIAVAHASTAIGILGDVSTPKVDLCASHIGLPSGACGHYTIFIAERAEGIDLIRSIAHQHIIVVAIGASIDATHLATAHIHTGVAADIATDVVAAENALDATFRGVENLHIGSACNVGLITAAIDGAVDLRFVTIHLDEGGNIQH